MLADDANRVLLIEDDEDDYLLTRDLLAHAQDRYHVVWKRDAASGIEALLAGDVEVCLLDFRLGSTNGIEVLADARRRGVRTPIILLTGQSDRETDLQAMRAGASDYLIKGRLDEHVLERSIRYAIERARTVQALEDTERQFRSLIVSATDGIVIADGDGRLRLWNPSASALFGHADLEGHPFAELLCDPSRPESTTVAELSRRPSADVLDLEGVRSDGTRFPAEVALSSWESAEGTMWSAIIRDITERKALESQLEHQAFHDPLTGLANRALLRDRLEHALRRRPRSTSSRVAVLFLDLDDFKRVNDTLGHAVGDELLKQVAARLTAQLRSCDTPARLGGDEFAVVVEDIESPFAAIEIASRILGSLENPFTIDGATIAISGSIGVDITTASEIDADTVLRHADVAMYAAKERGKRQYALFESEMHERIVRRVHAERDLREAVELDQIVAHYQPIFDMTTGRIAAVEALMRWRHPTEGLQLPGLFVHVAEETGLIVPLGRQLRALAFGQLRSWRAAGGVHPDVYVSVNASPRELEDREFVAEILASVHAFGLEPRSVAVEITESVMLSNRELATRRLEELRDAGIRIAIDDFGMGYSSLSYVQELPAQILKIDRSFVSRVAEPSGRSLISAILAMSRSLGLLTVAEGIDDDGKLLLLRSLGCEFGQGFHLALPGDASATGPLLTGALDLGEPAEAA